MKDFYWPSGCGLNLMFIMRAKSPFEIRNEIYQQLVVQAQQNLQQDRVLQDLCSNLMPKLL
ncbi:hypothetical protein INT80_14990 [Gallibacterium anatis]|uniref:Uncharacterized protein n=1 Tax=Gallibacterium anatis TaxID=750 RepID=A0A930USG2_9PAST|nr:hypothetical protein [Gallibacterium anatis]